MGSIVPERLQRKRTKGYRLPSGAVYVGRPTRFGNPFQDRDRSRGLVRFGPQHLERFGRAWDYEGRCSGPGSHDVWFSSDDIVKTNVRWATREELVELFRLTLTDPTPGMRSAYPSRGGHFLKVTVEDIRRELAGKDLACWCPLPPPGEPDICHAAVLLAVARGEMP